MKFIPLETDRLNLVEINLTHAKGIFEILSLAEVTKYYGTDPFTSIDDAKKLIEMFQKNFYEKRAIRWGIVRKDNHQLIGTLGLNSLYLKNKKAEIGYELHPNHWRKGYASEAIQEVLRYCFENMELNRVGAIVYPENHASLQLLEKFGFMKEGLLRDYLIQNNQSHNTYMLSILKREWEQRYK